jgi:hypothetical protein
MTVNTMLYKLKVRYANKKYVHYRIIMNKLSYKFKQLLLKSSHIKKKIIFSSIFIN